MGIGWEEGKGKLDKLEKKVEMCGEGRDDCDITRGIRKKIGIGREEEGDEKVELNKRERRE